jgi:acylphosphatase
MLIRKHVQFIGRVQGVFFRSNTQRKAQELGVTGWVRNMDDGSVEATFEGEDSAVSKLIEWCSYSIPHANVTGVKITKQDYMGEFGGFEIWR